MRSPHTQIKIELNKSFINRWGLLSWKAFLFC